ncbi:MAG: UDP-N-acetylglucosamine 1-carboxyvinyltransferase [Brevinema sp.]
MDKFIINGGKPLKGTVCIGGAKNAALPLLAASLLTKEPIILHNVPMLEDIQTMFALLSSLGKKLVRDGSTVTITEEKTIGFKAPYDIVSRMRASIAVMGPLAARLGQAVISLPGGCNLGPRPIDLHIKGMEELGALCETTHGYINVTVPQGKLVGKRMNLLGKSGPSVLGTENIMMAATLAKGTTVIDGSAREPEVSDLAGLLNAMGANISGIGSSTLTIEGCDELHGAEYTVIADRIETGTFILIAGITKGDVTIKNCRPDHLETPISVFREAGMIIDILDDTTIRVRAGKTKGVKTSTLPYPEFPTDLQAQFLSYLALSEGNSIIEETIYPDRFMHAAELVRMGADIQVDQGLAVVSGVDKLSGASVMSSDLRGGAALVAAALAAEGISDVLRIYHIDRGYESFEIKLQKLGADIQRAKQ